MFTVKDNSISQMEVIAGGSDCFTITRRLFINLKEFRTTNEAAECRIDGFNRHQFFKIIMS